MRHPATLKTKQKYHNEDPQYAIFMEAQARLEAEGLGDCLPNLCLLITSESLNFGNIGFRLFMDIVNFLSVDDARTFGYQSQILVLCYVLPKQHCELILRTFLISYKINPIHKRNQHQLK